MDLLEKIQELCYHGKYEMALHEIAKLEKSGTLIPKMFVLKARCIQLGTGKQCTLDDAEHALLLALKIDDEYIEALLELGWYYLNVKDIAEEAMPLFQRAVEISRGRLSEAILGNANCLHELSSPEAVRLYLREFSSQITDKEALESLMEEIEN